MSVVIRADGVSSGSAGSVQKPRGGGRKKCLCLSAWLAFLLLLCVAVVVIANYLLPKSLITDADFEYSVVRLRDAAAADPAACLESAESEASLEQKARWSEHIVVAKWKARRSAFKAVKVLKGTAAMEDDVIEVQEPTDEFSSCLLLEDDLAAGKNLVLFLNHAEHDRWHHRFRSVEATDKLADVIARLVKMSADDEATKNVLALEEADEERLEEAKGPNGKSKFPVVGRRRRRENYPVVNLD